LLLGKTILGTVKFRSPRTGRALLLRSIIRTTTSGRLGHILQIHLDSHQVEFESMPLKSSSSYAGRSRRDSARSLFLRVFSGAVLFAGLGLGGARADDATAKADVEAFLAAGEFQAAAKRAAEENGPVRDQLMAHIASFQAAQQKPAIAQRALR